MSTSAPAPARKHFSMIRGFHLADAFTLGNAACGVGAIFLAMAFMRSQSLAHFLWAAALAPRPSSSTSSTAASRAGARPTRRWAANSTRWPT